MVFPVNFLLLFGICMLVSAIGFKNYVWFISLGYGFSIAAEGLAMLILYGQQLTLGTILCCGLFIIYGLRLGGYLAIRELGSSSYKKNMKGEIKEGSTVPFGVKIAIWVTCALLYVTQIAGVFYRLHNGAADNITTFIGAGIMALGLTLETAADLQKNAAKKVNPRRFVDTGLYRTSPPSSVPASSLSCSAVPAVWRSVRTRTTARIPNIRSTSPPCPFCCPSSPCTA